MTSIDAAVNDLIRYPSILISEIYQARFVVNSSFLIRLSSRATIEAYEARPLVKHSSVRYGYLRESPPSKPPFLASSNRRDVIASTQLKQLPLIIRHLLILESNGAQRVNRARNKEEETKKNQRRNAEISKDTERERGNGAIRGRAV